MKKVPQAFIDSLLAKVDLEKVVSDRIRLDRSQTPARAQCPFHDDDTHSLIVDNRTGQYGCEHCAITGSAIGFVMYHDNVHFSEAIKLLSAQAGIDVSAVLSDDDLSQPTLENLSMLSTVADRYHDCLLESQVAIKMLAGRGVSEQSIVKFKLGLSPANSDHLFTWFPNQKLSLTRAGLVARAKAGRYYARFRHRLMIPILDAQGQVCGFGARSIDETDQPKYLNSPASTHFYKSSMLFNINNVIERSPEERHIIITEGYFDVIALSQRGFPMAVSGLGTAFTDAQIRMLLSLHPQSITVCFDGDRAGRAATTALVSNLLMLNADNTIDIRVLPLPDEHDPDSFIQQYGDIGFADALVNASPMEAYFFDSYFGGIDPSSIGDIASTYATVRPVISQITSPQSLNAVQSMFRERFGIDLPE